MTHSQSSTTSARRSKAFSAASTQKPAFVPLGRNGRGFVRLGRSCVLPCAKRSAVDRRAYRQTVSPATHSAMRTRTAHE
jgi:hypothetical protein